MIARRRRSSTNAMCSTKGDIVEFIAKRPPREFEVGFDKKGIIRDCGTMSLDPDEQITFVTEDGKEYDVTRKEWGFYAGPSLNGRLAGFNLRAVLLKNRINRYFVLLVERGKEGMFEQYVREESMQLISWLDSDAALGSLEEKLKPHGRPQAG
jgi:hypothetical protein